MSAATLIPATRHLWTKISRPTVVSTSAGRVLSLTIDRAPTGGSCRIYDVWALEWQKGAEPIFTETEVGHFQFGQGGLECLSGILVDPGAGGMASVWWSR